MRYAKRRWFSAALAIALLFFTGYGHAYYNLGAFWRAPQNGGTLWTWGYNNDGQLGHGDKVNRWSPTQVGTSSNWARVSGGYATSAAVKTDGTLWTWGYNSFGELCDGSGYPGRLAPLQVGTATDWVSVTTSGQFTTMAIKIDGTLWGCGYNNNGQLGVGDTINRTSLVQTAGSNWSSVMLGDTWSMGLKRDGTLWVWGRVDPAFFNCSSTGCYGTTVFPTQIRTATDWRSFAVSPSYIGAVAIKTDGSLWTWGMGSYGDLGLGDTSDRSSPTRVGTGTNWKSVAKGIWGALAIKTDGTLWAWGMNGASNLGLGWPPYPYDPILGFSQNYVLNPIQVGTATNWAGVAMQNYVSLAVKTDGTLWAVGGYNGVGQLGVGDTARRLTLTQVGAGTNWAAVAGADNGGLGIRQ